MNFASAVGFPVPHGTASLATIFHPARRRIGMWFILANRLPSRKHERAARFVPRQPAILARRLATVRSLADWPRQVQPAALKEPEIL